jgi:hypothetical protein
MPGDYTPYAAGGDMVVPARPELQYQPYSSVVTCNAGENVLLRFASLGFKQETMTLTGIKMRIVGKDATQLKSPYATDSIVIGAGESVDAIFTAPAFSGGLGSSGLGYDTYVLYNRAFKRSNNLAAGGFGGQRTEVRVYPNGSLSPQAFPHQDTAL